MVNSLAGISVALNAVASTGAFTPSGIGFERNGAEEGGRVTGTGWADMRDDGHLEGEFAYDKGDDTSFIAEPRFSSSLLGATCAGCSSRGSRGIRILGC